MDDATPILYALGIALLISMIFSLVFTFDIIEIKEQAIKHECAYYHPQTGQFTWKSNVELD